MDLPTYTNIWRIEKRLYKLYDFRLPMPLPVGTFGVALGVFALWVVLLSILNAPFAFGNGWHLVLWVVPPGVITVLATRPVIEGKRLTELLISQARFLTEARVFTRLAPEYEPAEIRVSVRVWHRDAEAGPLPLPRGARRAQTETEAEVESQAAPAEVQEPEEAPDLESARRAAPPLRGVPARPPVPVVEHDDSVEYTPARKVPVAVAAGPEQTRRTTAWRSPGSGRTTPRRSPARASAVVSSTTSVSASRTPGRNRPSRTGPVTSTSPCTSPRRTSSATATSGSPGCAPPPGRRPWD
ncbi:conjugal transfer protein [Nocardiopsis eucommiae]|uniref:Conjugal transfer protein n=1 Tax=Nocardiopsis eucommiae TaxID=2831970 RepID=A0A975L8N5_9ACTN|nr:conjugal transfer protein [Nocardiopsis eucommiae]